LALILFATAAFVAVSIVIIVIFTR
jgi:hypothetical protein